ncbi:MAG: hypothetical protein ACRDRR_23810, partial [Pseudonocardiaceae bacterium]
ASDMGLYRQADCPPQLRRGCRRAWHTGATSTTFCRSDDPKRLVALQRSILVIIFHLLADPTTEFTDLGPDFYTRRINLARRTDQLTRQLQALGYNVQLTPADAA